MRCKNPVIRRIRAIATIGSSLIIIISQYKHQRIFHCISKLRLYGSLINPCCYRTVLYLIRILKNLISICIIHVTFRIITDQLQAGKECKRVFTTKLKIYAIRLYGFFRYFRSFSAGSSQITVHHLKFPFGYIGIRSKAVTGPCFVCLHFDAVSVECCCNPDVPAPKSGSAVFGGNYCIAFGCFAQLEYDIAVSGVAYIV